MTKFSTCTVESAQPVDQFNFYDIFTDVSLDVEIEEDAERTYQLGPL